MGNREVTISVVIPLYNAEQTVGRAINSVLEQTYHVFDVIVVDDGSKDEGPDIVMNFHDPRIHLIKQNNKGPAGARNTGISYSKAELIAFLDADDEWSKDFLSNILLLFQKFPTAGIYATAYDVCPDDGKNFWDGLPKPDGIITDFFRAQCIADRYPSITPSFVAIPKAILEEYGGFNEKMIYGKEDWDLWSRIALDYPIAYSCNIGGVYHLSKGQISKAKRDVSLRYEMPFLEYGRKRLIEKNYRSEYLNEKSLEEFLVRNELQAFVANIFIEDRFEAIKKILRMNSRNNKKEKAMALLLYLIPERFLSVIFRTRVH